MACSLDIPGKCFVSKTLWKFDMKTGRPGSTGLRDDTIIDAAQALQFPFPVIYTFTNPPCYITGMLPISM